MSQEMLVNPGHILNVNVGPHLIACKTGATITTTPSNDPRSYRQNSDKLLNTGFEPLFSIDHAVDELSDAFATGELVDSEQSHTVKWMASLGLANG